MTASKDKTHCVNGHPFTENNTRRDARTGRRSCIECGRIRSREYQRRKRADQPRQADYRQDSDLYNQQAIQRLHASYRIDASTGCWAWSGGLNPEGYGNFWYLGQTVNAHRAAYLLLKGEIKSGLHLDHLCRNRRCIYPEHLEPVTVRENVLRGVGPAPKNAAKTHCVRGHKLSGDNLVPSALKVGKRCCQICQRTSVTQNRLATQKARGLVSDSTAARPL